MSAIGNLPTNKNFLSPLGFNFSIKKTPGVNYFVQSASIPSITTGVAQTGTPFNYLKDVGDKITYGDFNLTLRVDEELRNYMELHTWIKNNSRQSFEGYRGQTVAAMGEGVKSDASLIILSSSKNPIVEVVFKNMFPIILSDLTFDTRKTDVEYIDVSCTFAYQSYDVKYLI